MKFITSVILSFALLIGAMHVTSCSAFSKTDAQALGIQIATSSLAVAAKVAAGEQVDLKQEIAAIGLQVASSAVNTVGSNLAKNAAATPQSLVLASHNLAQDAIAAAAVPAPEIATQAASIATQAVAAAQARLGATAAPTGK